MLVFLRQSFIAVLVLISLAGQAIASENDAKKFVDKLGADVLSVITSKSFSEKQKEQKLTIIFENAVDTGWIGQFVLGRYWREASKEQKDTYIKLHKKFLIGSYIPKFKDYNGQKFETLKATKVGEGEYLIETNIIAPDSPATKVDYKVREKNGQFKVYDVVAEGISMITTQRDDFGTIVSGKGLDALIEMLRSRV